MLATPDLLALVAIVFINWTIMMVMLTAEEFQFVLSKDTNIIIYLGQLLIISFFYCAIAIFFILYRNNK